jgi:hypothetical protein
MVTQYTIIYIQKYDKQNNKSFVAAGIMFYYGNK